MSSSGCHSRNDQLVNGYMTTKLIRGLERVWDEIYKLGQNFATASRVILSILCGHFTRLGSCGAGLCAWVSLVLQNSRLDPKPQDYRFRPAHLQRQTLKALLLTSSGKHKLLVVMSFQASAHSRSCNRDVSMRDLVVLNRASVESVHEATACMFMVVCARRRNVIVLQTLVDAVRASEYETELGSLESPDRHFLPSSPPLKTTVRAGKAIKQAAGQSIMRTTKIRLVMEHSHDKHRRRADFSYIMTMTRHEI